jgi:hypothetical protein
MLAAPAHASTRTDLTLHRVTTGTPLSGTSVRFTGTAPSSMRGKYVKLQRSVGSTGAWVTLTSAKVSSTGRIATAGRAASIGLNRWRLLRADAVATHVSPFQRTTVYNWFNLSGLDYVDSHRFDEGGAAIAGRYFPNSVMNSTSFWYDKNDWREWNLGYKCKSLSATVGLRDDSATGSQVAFTSTLDGANTDWGTLGLGQSKPVNQAVNGFFRLRLQDTYVAGPLGSGDTSGYGVWGNAKILCMARPAPAL